VASGAIRLTKEPGKFTDSPQMAELVQELADTQDFGIAVELTARPLVAWTKTRK
jgi:hypothetical protein